jgi:succinyl-diaminopimelate desuccinylase
MMKIGRRGSVNIWLTWRGKEGHVAYPHLADNPAPRLVAMLAELDALELDGGTDWFQPSNLEITDIAIGNPATNVIPPQRRRAHLDPLQRPPYRARAWRTAWRRSPRATAAPRARSFRARPSSPCRGRSPPGRPRGRSGDRAGARSLDHRRHFGRAVPAAVCPVIEFGLCNATMHKRDEAVAVPDLDALARIYARIAAQALSA